MQRRQARRRINYVIPQSESVTADSSTTSARSSGIYNTAGHGVGHSLGINSLALHINYDDESASSQTDTIVDVEAIDQNDNNDSDNTPRHSTTTHIQSARLYTAGRDGVVAAWDLPHYETTTQRSMTTSLLSDSVDATGLRESTLDLSHKLVANTLKSPKLYAASQHHADWVNDVVVCHEGNSVVSASSDRTVKLWQPNTDPTGRHTRTIAIHRDYVRALVYPRYAGWVASGGLDRQVCVWDLGETRSYQQPIVSFVEKSEAASVYALACDPYGQLLMAGAPDKLIRVWDPRSGQRVAVLAGHTELVRALLISDDGRTALSASSDTTIKLWSLVAGRCVATYNTRDNESIWSLFSEDPHLRCFYAGSKDGLVTKHWLDNDDTEAMVVPILRETSGINKLVGCSDRYLWTATTSSDIRCWKDVSHEEASYARTSLDASLTFNIEDVTSTEETSSPMEKHELVHDHDHVSISSDYMFAQPLRSTPESIVYGKRGLIKYHILNDRRMVLTENTAGEVLLWDIIKCKCVKSFGQQSFDSCLESINPEISVPTWCSVDTRIGSLTVTLDERRCFDAEVYADELDLPPNTIPIERLEEQRVNLGKWILRGLFSQFADAYIKELIEDEKALSEVIPTSNHLTNEVNDGDTTQDTELNEPNSASILLDTDTTPSVLPLPSPSPSPSTSNTLFTTPLNSDTTVTCTTSPLPSVSSPSSRLVHSRSHVFSAPPSCTTSPELPPINMASPTGSPVALPRTMLKEASFLEEPRRPETVHQTLASNEYFGSKDESMLNTLNSTTATATAAAAATATTAAPSPPMLSNNLRSYTEPAGPPLLKNYNDSFTTTEATASTTATTTTFNTATTLPNSPVGMPPPVFSNEKSNNNTASTGTAGSGSGSGGFMRRLKSFSMKRPNNRQQNSLTIGLGDKSNKMEARMVTSSSLPVSALLDKDNQQQQQQQQQQQPASAAPNTTTFAQSDQLGSPAYTHSPQPQQPQQNNLIVTQALSNQPSSSSSIARRRIPVTITSADSLSYGLDAPPLQLPDEVTVAIVEESQDTCGTTDMYRGQLVDTATDCTALDTAAPNWLMDFIFQNATPPREPVRLSFVLMPYPDSGLPDLSKGAIRLTANRALRIRKVLAYVLDRLELPDMPSNQSLQVDSHDTPLLAQLPNDHNNNTSTSDASNKSNNKQKPEAWLEVLCQDKVLAPTMTLATVRTFIWKSGGDIALYYRARIRSIPSISTNE